MRSCRFEIPADDVPEQESRRGAIICTVSFFLSLLPGSLESLISLRYIERSRICDSPSMELLYLEVDSHCLFLYLCSPRLFRFFVQVSLFQQQMRP